MKAKNITLLLLAAFIAVMLVSTVSFADTYNPGRGWHFLSKQRLSLKDSGCRPRGTDCLNLSQEQIAQINQLRFELKKDSLELKKEIAVKMLEIRELARQNPVEMDSIKTKWEEMAKIQIELRMKTLENQQQIKQLLTPEQLEKFNLNCPIQRRNLPRGNFNDFNRGDGLRRNRQ